MASNTICDERITEILRKVNNIESTLHDMKIMMGVLFKQQNQNSNPSRGETNVHLPDKRRKGSKHFPECTMKEYVHKEVLQEKYQKIVNRLDFSKDNVLDKLVEGEVISESDHEVVLKLSCKRKDQNRYLIHRFRRYGTDKFKTFLESLKEDYSDLASDLRVSFEEKLKESNKTKCAHCTIVHTVDISDVLDSLFENKIIDDEITDQKLRGIPTASLWIQLFLQLKISPFPAQECKDILVDSLYAKYKDIAEVVKVTEFDRIFSCFCKSSSRERMSIASDFQTDGSGSLSDVSSISTVHSRDGLPWTLTSPSIEKSSRDKNYFSSQTSLVSRDDVEPFDHEKSVFCNTPKESLFDSKVKMKRDIQTFLKREPARRHTVEVTENISEFQDKEVDKYDRWQTKQSRAKETSEFDVLKRKLKSIPTLQSGTSKSFSTQKPESIPTLQSGTLKSFSTQKPQKGTYTCINSQRYQQSMNMGEEMLIEKEGTVKVLQNLQSNNDRYYRASDQLSSFDYYQNSFEDSQLLPDLMLKDTDKRTKHSVYRRSPRFKTA